jgi:hypothetical protein
MSPEDALQKQIEAYRRMTPGQRLKIGLELHDLACELSRSGIRSQNPQASDADVEAELRRRLESARR